MTGCLICRDNLGCTRSFGFHHPSVCISSSISGQTGNRWFSPFLINVTSFLGRQVSWIWHRLTVHPSCYGTHPGFNCSWGSWRYQSSCEVGHCFWSHRAWHSTVENYAFPRGCNRHWMCTSCLSESCHQSWISVGSSSRVALRVYSWSSSCCPLSRRSHSHGLQILHFGWCCYSSGWWV